MQIIALGLLAVGFSLVNLPFDILTGFAVESAFQKTAVSFRKWLMHWMIGRSLCSLGLFLGFLLMWGNHIAGGSLTSLFLLLAGIGIAGTLFCIPTGFPSKLPSPEARYEDLLRHELQKLNVSQRPIRWFENDEICFVNGYLSPTGRLCLSKTIVENLTPRESALLVAREEWFRKSGATLLGFLISAGWLLTGLWVAFSIPSPSGIAAALMGSAVLTGWCFLALFLWPSLNRHWMTQADRFLVTKSSRPEVSMLLEKLQMLNATDEALSKAKTTVFHPIPPLRSRLDALS
jgi:Zn-dependent protease with chaperone function